MAINPFAQPINYSAQFVDLTPAFKAAGEGFRAIGEGIQEREKQEQAMNLKAQYSTDLQNALNNPTQATWSQMIAKYPQQREAFAEARKGFGETALANEFSQGFEVSTALENKRPEVAKERLQTFITARKNSNLPTGIYEDALEALERDDVLGAQANVNSALAMADPDRFQKQVEARLKASTAPSALKKSVADADAALADAEKKAAEAKDTPARLAAEQKKRLAEADKAEAEAKVKMETATDDIAKAKATREFEQAKAKKEQIQADTELETRLQAIGLQKAQINKFKVETRNLDTQGKMLSLDFQAALNGLPLPSKKTEGGGGTATEDERKAAGWLAQATNAYNNMLGAMYTKEGKTTGAEKPGVIESALGTLPFIGEGSAALARGTDRQKFTQAASSLSEALLRAATGAGVNRDEAKQKLEELTPLFTDDADTRKQKLAAIPVYLDSLKSRAGRAAPSGYQVPQAPTNALSITLPDGTVFTAPNQKALDEFKRRAGL
jgi:hypothetical protein